MYKQVCDRAIEPVLAAKYFAELPDCTAAVAAAERAVAQFAPRRAMA